MPKVKPKTIAKAKPKLAPKTTPASNQKSKAVAPAANIDIIGRVRSVDSKTQVTINFSGPIPAIPGGTVKVLSPRGDYGMNIETVIYLVEEISPNVVTGKTRQYIYTYPIWDNDVVIPYTPPRTTTKAAKAKSKASSAPQKRAPKAVKRQ